MVAHYEPEEENVAPPAGGAIEPDDDRWRQQGYTPLDMVDGDPIFLMRAPDAAGDLSDDEYDSDSDGREDVEPAAGTGTLDFRNMTDALLASMEDDYRRTIEAGRRPAAVQVVSATDAATGSIAAAATEGPDLEGAATDDEWRPCAVEQSVEAPSSSAPLAPPEAPLSQEKEEEIKTIMTGVTLSQSAVPGWAEGLAWDIPDIQELLKSLQK